ncbi:hypothetical protein B0A49_10476 [Cryomyces minteri]|uniref:Uncharacterized protein n=1 Tax=Cryomyces minteri TaxID=331657 RepID=A0A4U0WJD2_9PEZI|nr:hypothetical protein B0A49_10476 [Cryomyces minteri]
MSEGLELYSYCVLLRTELSWLDLAPHEGCDTDSSHGTPSASPPASDDSGETKSLSDGEDISKSSSCMEEMRQHESSDEEDELELIIREECAIAMGSEQHVLTPSPPAQLSEKPKAMFNIMAVTGDMASLNDFYRFASVDAEVVMGVMALHHTAPSVSRSGHKDPCSLHTQNTGMALPKATQAACDNTLQPGKRTPRPTSSTGPTCQPVREILVAINGARSNRPIIVHKANCYPERKEHQDRR